MKKSFFFLLAVSSIVVDSVDGQSILSRVKSSVSNKITGNSDDTSSKPGPEPSCARDDAKLIMDLGGKLKIDYNEISISVKDEGSILVKDKPGGKYYVVKDGVTQGPYDDGDHRIKGFDGVDDDGNGIEALLLKYKGYISRSGEKYLITFFAEQIHEKSNIPKNRQINKMFKDKAEYDDLRKFRYFNLLV
jgi:hypothetical protein